MLLWNTFVRFIFSFLFQLPAVIDCLLVASTSKNNSTTVEHESVNAIAQYVEIFQQNFCLVKSHSAILSMLSMG